MSICKEVTPRSVPATLKSMSPRWSSSPRMSDSTAKPRSSLISPMAMPATGRSSGTPASISASDDPHTVAIDEEPLLSVISRDHAQRVRELVLRRQQRVDRPPGELAVADLTPAGRAHAPGLAHRIGREIVVQHEVLAVLAFERVDDLLVLPGAERRDAQRLRLAAGEQGGAVRARQHAHLGDDRAHGAGVAPVDAQPGVQDGVADDVGFQLLERHPWRARHPRLGGQRRQRGFLRRADPLVAHLLLALGVGGGQRPTRCGVQLRGQRLLLGSRPPAAARAPSRRARPVR